MAKKPAVAKPDVLRFVVGRSSLGAVLVAVGAKGVVAILLGENPRRVVQQLEELYPKSQLVEGTSADEQLLALVTAHIEDPARELKLRLDLRGTEFQQRVWRAVARIPFGQTRTYADIAQRIGAPRAMRAVGSACAKCHFYFAVPCHRVIVSSPAALRLAEKRGREPIVGPRCWPARPARSETGVK